MLIQIQPTQVPAFWEVIKFAAVKSDKIEDEYVEYYCIELLQDLLCSNKICFIVQEKEKILFVIIIEFKMDKMRNMKFLYFNNLYSFSSQKDSIWLEVFNDLYKIAKIAECKAIFGDSDNEKIEHINQSVGASWISKKYAYYL